MNYEDDTITNTPILSGTKLYTIRGEEGESYNLRLCSIPEVIKLLHRHSNGVITLHNKSPKFCNLGSLHKDELIRNLSYLEPHITEEAYFSINAFNYNPKGKGEVNGLFMNSRKEHDILCLNALYLDLDVGREEEKDTPKGIAAETALERCKEMVRDGMLPQFNIYTKSGRGLYLFWLLADENGLSPLATPESLSLYRNLLKRLQVRTSELASDSNTSDAARILRIPNTMHSKNGKPAEYFLATDKTYSLEEMEKFFGVEERVSQHPPRRPLPPRPQLHPVENANEAPQPPCRPYKLNERRTKRGRVGYGERRATDIEKLENYYGGFPQGCRRIHLTHYVMALRASRVSKIEAHDKAKGMANRCQPPYPSEPGEQKIENLVDSIYKAKVYYNYKNETIANELRVNVELADQLGLQSIAPPEIKALRKARQPKRIKVSFIADYLMRHPDASGREIAKTCQANGVPMSRQQANRIRRKSLAIKYKPIATAKVVEGQFKQRSGLDANRGLELPLAA